MLSRMLLQMMEAAGLYAASMQGRQPSPALAMLARPLPGQGEASKKSACDFQLTYGT
jgi:hypothetical protein